MAVLTPRDAAALAEVLSRRDGRLVVCLCAAWCDTCEEFKHTFERLAAADASSAYVWVDIEDDSAIAGDIDVENFPTLAVFRSGRPVFYGVTLPQEPVVARTLSAFQDPDAAAVAVPEGVGRLPEALKGHAAG
jgi:thioredoxin 1